MNTALFIIGILLLPTAFILLELFQIYDNRPKPPPRH